MEVKNISISKIKLGRNSRMNVSDDEIAGLMASIKSEGLLQPVGLYKSTKGYEIAYGNRRFLALSKLGRKLVPSVILSGKSTRAEIDLKNLTENVQRKNISLMEVGRYIESLIKEGLTVREIAIRMGVAQTYIKSCQNAFFNVPKELRGKVEVNMGRKKSPIGKIALDAATKIEAARKQSKVNTKEARELYKIAESDKFNRNHIDFYIAAIKKGKKSAEIIKTAPRDRHVSVSFALSEIEYNRLHKKYIDNGAHRGMSEIFRLKLEGKLSFKAKIDEWRR